MLTLLGKPLDATLTPSDIEAQLAVLRELKLKTIKEERWEQASELRDHEKRLMAQLEQIGTNTGNGSSQSIRDLEKQLAVEKEINKHLSRRIEQLERIVGHLRSRLGLE